MHSQPKNINFNNENCMEYLLFFESTLEGSDSYYILPLYQIYASQKNQKEDI